MLNNSNQNIQPDITNMHTDKSILGFWIYLMTDLIMFAALFATYSVLRYNTFGGPGASELFSLSNALIGTLILLTSSFTCGLGMLSARFQNVKQTYLWFGLTFILGLSFLFLEFKEFHELIIQGYSWQSNAFLSAFFTLIGIHGAHIVVGILWIAISFYMVYKKGLTPKITSQLYRLSLFWHFLDVVWIFIFTIVYLLK
jgi:cytochrome o ubiquinol oxidase subunit 3